MLNSGQLLAERYRLGNRIAVGGMGEVWQAVDVRLDRTVAVKVLKPELCGDAEFLHRFRTEARTTASLNHPGIAAVHDYGETAAVPDGPQDTAYLVMEHVDGEPLAAILAREGRVTTEHTLEMLEQAGNALHAAHERGLVHRDVKPGNILVTPNGTIKITDFGIAKAADAAPVTRSGMVMGTAHYISPEQALGSDATPGSDVYSLAVVGYECLKGHRPFLSDNAVTVAMMHIREVPPQLPPDVPPPVRALIEATLVKDPRMRYSDGGEFANAVASVRAGRPLPTPVGLSIPQQPHQQNQPQHQPQQYPAHAHHTGVHQTGVHPTGNQPQAPQQTGQQQLGQHPQQQTGQPLPNGPTMSPSQPTGVPSAQHPPAGPPNPTGRHPGNPTGQPGNTLPPGVIPPQQPAPSRGNPLGAAQPGPMAHPPPNSSGSRQTMLLWIGLAVLLLVVLAVAGFALWRMYDRGGSGPDPEGIVGATAEQGEDTTWVAHDYRDHDEARVRFTDFGSRNKLDAMRLRHPDGRLSSAAAHLGVSAAPEPPGDTTHAKMHGVSNNTDSQEVGGTAPHRCLEDIGCDRIAVDMMGRSWTKIGTTQR